jgi:competence protein ComEC
MGPDLFRQRPALRFVLLFAAGIIAGELLAVDPVILFAASAAILLVSLGLLALQRVERDLTVSLLLVVLGMFVHTVEKEDRWDKRMSGSPEGDDIELVGEVDEALRARGNRRQMLLREESGRRILVHGRASLFERIEGQLGLGVNVRVTGYLEPFPQPSNPGEFDFGRYLEMNDIQGMVAVRNPGSIVVLAPPEGFSLRRALASTREAFIETLDGLHPRQQSSFLRGILLADRSNIPADVRQSFVDTGTVHVLAVSGLHVGIIALVFHAVFGLLRLPRRLVIIATVVGLAGYAALIGSPPSVVRATVMATVILAGGLVERRTDVYQSLGVAACLLLLWDTNNLFDVGFQLSFSAVVSIVYFYPVFAKVIHRIPEAFEEIKGVDYILKLFAVSLAAQIGTLPFTAYYFERISIASLVANLVVVPVVGLNVMLGFATLVFASVSSWLALSFAALNDFLIAFLFGFVRFGASFPFAYIETSQLAASFPIIYYIGVVGLFHINRPRAFKLLVIACLLWLNGETFHALAAGNKHELTLTMLDVGQGDATYIEFPNGKRALIDAGPRTLGYDAGERVIVPFLKRQGVKELDAVVLSHAHSDHIGGIPAVLQTVRVARIIEPIVGGSSSLYREIHRKASDRGVPVQQLSVGDTMLIDPAVRMYVLHPSEAERGVRNLNDGSLVVKLVYGSTSVLFTGDAELEAELRMARRYESFLNADVLKAGHHGSATSSSRAFVERVAPDVTLISVGLRNKFRHPSVEVVQRFRTGGVVVQRTDHDGAVVLSSDGSEWRRVDWRRNPPARP